MSNFPVVKIELEGMRHVICHAFTNYQLEIDSQFQEALKVAVENFDYRGEVARIAARVIRDSIETAVTDAMGEMRRNPEFRRKVADLVQGAILK